jgi:hypothetical protein
MKLIFRRIVPMFVISTIALLGCSAKREQDRPQSQQRSVAVSAVPGEADSDTGYSAADSRGGMVQSANLTLEVYKCDDAIKLIEEEAAGTGGRVLGTKVESPEDAERTATVQLRVPALSLDSFLDSLRRSAKRVESEGTHDTDIRSRLDDATSRLTIKKQAEAQYVSMLRTARTATDQLEVSKALFSTRENISSLERARATLLDEIANPKVTILLRERNPLDDPARPGFWKRVRRGFDQGVTGIADVISWMIRVAVAGIPVYLLIGLLAVAAFRIFGVQRGIGSDRADPGQRPDAPPR